MGDTVTLTNQKITLNSEKIHAELKDRLKEKDRKEFVRVIIKVKNENREDLETISDFINLHRGSETNAYELGSSIVTELPIEELDTIADKNAIEGIWSIRNVSIMLDTSVEYMNSTTLWNIGYRGQNVKIAILDTGINKSHPMLTGKVLNEKVFTREENATDGHGHGTHVAGIAVGTTANGGNYNGVAPNASLINAKVLTDQGSGTTDWILAGINWAVNPDGNSSTDDGADIISMSFGGTFSDSNSPILTALDDAINSGVIVISAVGNCGNGCPSSSCGTFTGVTFPGSGANVITVGAINDANGSVACFSGGANLSGFIKPDVVAPGVSIISSWKDGGYNTLSGTSMATPHIAGAVALLLSINNNLTHYKIKNILEYSAVDSGVSGKDTSYGSGFVNLSKLVKPILYISKNVTNTSDTNILLNISNYGIENLIITNYTCDNCNTITLSKTNLSFGADANFNISFSGSVSINIYSNDANKSIQITYVNPNQTSPVINSVSINSTFFIGTEVNITINASNYNNLTTTIKNPEGIFYNYSNNSFINFLNTNTKGAYSLNVTALNSYGSANDYKTFDINEYLVSYPFISVNNNYNITVRYKNILSSPQQITTNFFLVELDSYVSSNSTSSINANATFDFKFEWTPKIIGDYLLYFNISNSSHLIIQTNRTLYVNGSYNVSIDTVNVKEVGG